MMRDEKRKRLQCKSWKIGSAEEFLGLSADEATYIETKLKLADSLRKRHVERQPSQGELARMVKSSQSRVVKMEMGDPSVTLDLLIRTLLSLGASNRDVARIIRSSETAPSRQKNM